MPRFLLGLSIILFFFQVVVSIIFSSEIVNQNNLFNQLNQQHQSLSLKYRQLEFTLSQLTDPDLIGEFAKKTPYQPITKKIIIQP